MRPCALSWFVDNDVTRRLLTVRGVGGVTREVRVALNPLRLQALGATAADISRQLRQMQQESAGGRVDVGGGEQPVRTIATVQNAQQLGALQLAQSDGRRIRLDEVATVSDTIAEPRSAALLNGETVVGFEVSRSKGESEVSVGAAVQQALLELKAAHRDIELTEAFNFVDPVQEEYTGSMHLLYEGAILAVLVVWLFLRGLRATFVSAVERLPAVKQLPPGVKIIEIGDAEVMGELFASFGLAMLTGVLCIYIVLVLLFKDFLHPVTILCALPLSLGGAFVGLLLTDKSFSMPSLIGLIMLMGIATKNSILLVEYAIVARRDQGLSRVDALLDACRKRARPIVMTTLAMGAGMMPIAMGLGVADASFRSPMAIAVIGGLITSTVLSLLVVPAVFTYVDDVGNGWRRLQGWLRRHGARHDTTAAAPAIGEAAVAAGAPAARA